MIFGSAIFLQIVAKMALEGNESAPKSPGLNWRLIGTEQDRLTLQC